MPHSTQRVCKEEKGADFTQCFRMSCPPLADLAPQPIISVACLSSVSLLSLFPALLCETMSSGIRSSLCPPSLKRKNPRWQLLAPHLGASSAGRTQGLSCLLPPSTAAGRSPTSLCIFCSQSGRVTASTSTPSNPFPAQSITLRLLTALRISSTLKSPAQHFRSPQLGPWGSTSPAQSTMTSLVSCDEMNG